MSRDFSPQMHWAAYTRFPEIYSSNVRMDFSGKSWNLYSDEEFADRMAHMVLHVLAADIYGEIRTLLAPSDFEALTAMLQNLVDADLRGDDLSSFPVEIVDWYTNSRNHYYHEPNDAEFLAYLRGAHAMKNEAGQI